MAAVFEFMSRIVELVDADTPSATLERPQIEPGAIVRHLAKELREPLDAIESISFYLDMVMPRGQGRARRQLTVLQEQVQQINWILSDTMHFLQEGPLRREPLDLSEVVDKYLTEWKPAEGPGIRLSLERSLPLVSLDLVHFEHLLRNLAGYFRGVAIPESEIVARTFAANGEVVLEVRAVVAGSRVSEFDHLFQPFATQSRAGSGLALASVRRITDAHGGRVEVQSELDGAIALRLAFHAEPAPAD